VAGGLRPTSSPDTLEANQRIARHLHRSPYATIVLEGSYEEAGDGGRIVASPGDILLHGSFSAHQDRIANRPARVLDLPLPDDGGAWPARATLSDPDLFVRLAERDAREAAAGLLETLMPVDDEIRSAADALAVALRSPAPPKIGEWARARGRSREPLARQFQSLYGTSPAAYRLESLARRAWRQIVTTGDSLADIACDTGFADQPHMNRAVMRLTGSTPGTWRKWSQTGHSTAA
jgi:AraC-like DNA-binding protein